jgi:hypothetical protein
MVVAQVNGSAGGAMNDRESQGRTLLTGTVQVLGAPAAKAASGSSLLPLEASQRRCVNRACVLFGPGARLPVVTD